MRRHSGAAMIVSCGRGSGKRSAAGPSPTSPGQQQQHSRSSSHPTFSFDFVRAAQHRADCDAYAYALWRWSVAAQDRHQFIFRRLAPSYRHGELTERRGGASITWEESLPLKVQLWDMLPILLTLVFFTVAHSISTDAQLAFLEQQADGMRLISSYAEWQKKDKAAKMRKRHEEQLAKSSAEKSPPSATASADSSTGTSVRISSTKNR